MRRSYFHQRAATGALFIAIAVFLAFGCPKEARGEGPGPEKALSEGRDLTRTFVSLNKNRPPSERSAFRSGHVSPLANVPPAAKTADGFEIQLGRTNVPSPVVYEGKVFVSGGFGGREYYAYDAQTGKNLWAIGLDDDGPSSAAVAEGVVVFNTESCTIFACRADTGEQLWSYWLGDPLMSMPTIADGLVFTAFPAEGRPSARVEVKEGGAPFDIYGTHVLIAIELHSGKILWQKWIDGDVMSAPVADGADLYLTTFAGTVFRFRQRTGEILSARAARATSAPVVAQGKLYLSRRSDRDGESASESLADYDATALKQTGENNRKSAPYLDKKVQEKSQLKDMAMDYDAGNGFSGGAPDSSGWQTANEVVGQSNVSSLQSYQGSRALAFHGFNYSTMGDELVCTEAKTGGLRWKLKLEGDLAASGGFLGTPPLEAGDKIVMADIGGRVGVYNPETGALLRQFQVRGQIRYQPVVEKGWIYVTGTDGKLSAIDTGDRSLTGWPMWGADAARTNRSE